jgi:CubicO group peptidase (beta-lactamase class C family)
VSGQPFAAFADTNIFKPLGMTHTHFHDDVTRIVPNRPTGYSRAANGFRVATRTYTDTLVGNAGLFTTVGDLLRWERNFAKLQVGGPALIAELPSSATWTTSTPRSSQSALRKLFWTASFPEPADNTTDQSAVDRHVSLSPQQLEAKVGLYRNIGRIGGPSVPSRRQADGE